MRILIQVFVVAALLLLTGCPPNPKPTSDSGVGDASGGTTTKVIVSNMTDAGATVNVSFGADSVVLPAAWPFCGVDAGLTCSFSLGAASSQSLPTGGQYLNASIAFNGPVGCGSTIAEFTANSTNGFGTADVSLVNGWNANVQITVDGQMLGPATDAGNVSTFGVFPFGCDICVARSQPPCGISNAGCTSPGSCGCKTGTQYNPTVPCQSTYQKSDAGSLVNVALLP
jgi:hypothetical protein